MKSPASQLLAVMRSVEYRMVRMSWPWLVSKPARVVGSVAALRGWCLAHSAAARCVQQGVAASAAQQRAELATARERGCNTKHQGTATRVSTPAAAAHLFAGR
jgi:hypothetical protein